jgi:hypothetical protein
MTPSIGEGKLILLSPHSVRKRLSLLALASTLPFNCPRPESLRHRKDNRDHILFLELYLYIREASEASASVFALISALCIEENPVSGRAADFSGSKFRCSRSRLSRRSSSQKGRVHQGCTSLLSRHSRTLRLTVEHLI